jgi:hypothetical protein
MWFLSFCFTIFLIAFWFYLIYLRGKSLQHTWDSIITAGKQKKQKIDSLHNLSESDIDSIGIEYPHGKYLEIREPSRIREFKNILKESKISKIKYAYIPEFLKIKIQTRDKETICDAFVLASESTDAFLELLPEYRKYVICMSGLKSWIDENI